MSIYYMKADEAGVRILKHIRKHGRSTMSEIVYCNDSDCCDGDMSYSRFRNGRSWIGHIYLWAHDEPFTADHYGYYNLPSHWNEAVAYLLLLAKHLSTRADGFAAAARATNAKFSADPTVDASIKGLLALFQHSGSRLKSDISFIKQQIASAV